jgi:serine/threonine-protein kinase
MLSGEKPFKGENITALMYAITHNTYTPLPQVAPAAPACCVKIVDKLLQKGVTRRYRSAGQLTEQIKKCQQELVNHSVPSQK